MPANSGQPASTRGHLSSRFRHAERRVFFGRARLFTERIVFSGWRWTGRYRRTIRLDAIEQVRWWAGEAARVNMVVYLRDGTSFPFWVAAPGLWKYKLEELGGQHLRVTQELPGSVPPASAA